VYIFFHEKQFWPQTLFGAHKFAIFPAIEAARRKRWHRHIFILNDAFAHREKLISGVTKLHRDLIREFLARKNRRQGVSFLGECKKANESISRQP